MTIEIPGGYGLASASLQLTGDPEAMSVSFGIGGITDDLTAKDAVETFRAAFGVRLMPFVCNVYTLTGAEMLYRLPGADLLSPAKVVVDTSAIVVGGNTAQATPQNTAVLIHKRTGLAGRQYRGRTYLPGVGEGSVSPVGALTGDTGPQSTALAAFITDMNAGPYPLQLLHSAPKSGETPDPTPITSLVLDPIVATQRRRLRR